MINVAFQKGHKVNLGKKRSEEWKAALSKRMKGNTITLGMKHTEAWKKQHSEQMKGRKFTEEHKRHMSEVRIAKGLSKKEKNPTWNNGAWTRKYPQGWNRILKNKIKTRDNYICQKCGKKDKISVHHIDFNKDNLNELNLLTLCMPCNVHCNTKREYWINYFQEFMKKRFTAQNVV